MVSSRTTSFYKISILISPSNSTKIVCVFIVVFIFLGAALGFLSHWYMSSAAFAVGILFADKKEVIEEFIRKKERYTGVMIVLFIISFVSYIICFYYYSQSIISIPLRTFIIAPSFPILLLLLSSRFNFNNQILSYLGTYALELYVMQGLVFLLLKNNYWHVSNFLFVLIAFPLLLIISKMTHPYFSFVISRCRHRV